MSQRDSPSQDPVVREIFDTLYGPTGGTQAPVGAGFFAANPPWTAFPLAPLNPQHPTYGCKGDGVTDDNAGWAAFVTAVQGNPSVFGNLTGQSNPRGLKGIVPAGVYVVKQWGLSQSHGAWIEGQGAQGGTSSVILQYNGPAPLPNPSGALVLAQSAGASAFTNVQTIHVRYAEKNANDTSTSPRTTVNPDASIAIGTNGNVVTTSATLQTNSAGIRVYVGTTASPTALCDIDPAGNITYLGSASSGMAVGVAGSTLNLTISGLPAGSPPVMESSNGTATFLNINQARDTQIDHLSLRPGANNFGIGIDIDKAGAAPTVTTTHNKFRGMYIRSAVNAGVRVGHSRAVNCELGIWEGLIVDGVSANGTVDGVLFEDGQAKTHRFYSPNIGYCTNGFHNSSLNGATGGSFEVWGANFESNAIDILLGKPTDTIGVHDFYSENAGRLLGCEGNGSQGWPVLLENGVWQNSMLNADNNAVDWRFRGVLTMIAIAFGSYNANMRLSAGINVGAGARMNLIGCQLANNTPFASNPAQGAVLGCVYADNTGNTGLAYPDTLGALTALSTVGPAGAVITDASQSVALNGGTVTINPLLGTKILATISANTTIAFTANSAFIGTRLKFALTHDGTGTAYVLTWPANVKLAGGAFGTTKGGTNSANALDELELDYDGTNWREVSRALALA